MATQKGTMHIGMETAALPEKVGFAARLLAKAAGLLLLAFGAGAVTVLGAFAWFALAVPSEEVTLASRADGIVVLTGGASRIADALDLLASGHGNRLLISGVHPANDTSAISRATPAHEKVFNCCVDLDRSAMNTRGNAVETRRWVRDHGFHSLIVVTSNYHMPRALAELRYELPDVALTPFPVVSEPLRHEAWWQGAKARLLVSEFLKYGFAQIRMRIPRNDPETEYSRQSMLPMPEPSA